MGDSSDWLPAYAALDRLVAAGFNTHLARQAICERAHAGLIRSKAHLLKFDNEERSDHEIPKKFWWAKGQATLEQNWRAGDFSTWIDKTYHLQAFGVSFALSDIEKLVPADGAGPMSASVSADDLRIEDHLNAISKTAALSWKQALLDLNDDNWSLFLPIQILLKTCSIFLCATQANSTNPFRRLTRCCNRFSSTIF